MDRLTRLRIELQFIHAQNIQTAAQLLSILEDEEEHEEQVPRITSCGLTSEHLGPIQIARFSILLNC